MFSMNPGRCRQQSQIDSLPLNHFQYTRWSSANIQSANRLYSFDGLPRAQNGQQFLVTSPSVTTMSSSNYNFNAPLVLSQAPDMWSNPNQTQMNFDDHSINSYYGYSPIMTGAEQIMDYSHVPRTCFPYDQKMFHEQNAAIDQYDSAAYPVLDADRDNMRTSVEEPQSFDNMTQAQGLTHSSASPEIKDEPLSAPTSLALEKYSPLVLPSCDASEDGGRETRESTAVDGDDQSADEPYAKLIYRALMSAPGHSMVLQEIYQWFRQNTGKGCSDSKGWMNSIRHNLSMNAAFRKTERRVTDDETKKSTEWVLEDFAVKDGVQSTTRYRKGTGAKKSTRPDSHARLRQIASGKGGVATNREKFRKQRHRYHTPERSLQCNEMRHSRHFSPQAASQFSPATGTYVPRQSSPLTPPNFHTISRTPYCFPKIEQQQHVDMPFEDIKGLENVQGVYLHNSDPVFANVHGCSYADGLPRF